MIVTRPNLNGAILRFHFSTHPPQEGLFLYSPSATGDSWIISVEGDGGERSPVYIQQFDYMEIIGQAENGEGYDD